MGLPTEQGLHSQRDGHVEARLRVLEVDSADLTNSIEPVAQGIGMHTQALGSFLLLARLEISSKRRDEAPLACSVVLDERTEVPACVVDQAFIGYRCQQTGEPQLWHGHNLAPALEPGQRIHHRDDLALRGRQARGRFGRTAEADRYGESRFPVGYVLANLQSESVASCLIVARLGAYGQERGHAV